MTNASWRFADKEDESISLEFRVAPDQVDAEEPESSPREESGSNKGDEHIVTGAKKQQAQQKDREWLRVYATLQSQHLSGYGRAAYADMDSEALWNELCKPLKTGARYMSERASPEVERQGIGINR